MEAPQHPTVLELAQQLAEGFAALSGEYQLLFHQQRQLESKLSFAKQQYLDLLKRCVPDSLSQEHLTFLQDLEGIGSEYPGPSVDWKVQLDQDQDSERRDRVSLITKAESAAIALREHNEIDQVKIWSGPSADKDKKAATMTASSTQLGSIEKDFTTVGTPSRLECPFASRGGRGSPLATPRSSTSRASFRGRRSKRPSFNDPIRAEICGNDHVSASVSIEGSAAVCPIRFLDQHAPEEVAQYFENHKHEIPRSHEVCIKRFQSNAESIKQLDAKYGSLVNMIQGLGVKHQPWLPEDPGDAAEGSLVEGEQDDRVKKWAKAVTASLQDYPLEDGFREPGHILDETRTAHFDRPLKEIRVGESPSRPWGISVPAKYAKADNASVVSAATASPPIIASTNVPDANLLEKPSKCPFGHGAPKQAEQLQVPGALPVESISPPHVENETPYTNPVDGEQSSKPPQDSPKPVPQMIFNGPVFIGYPPDQLMSLLQHSNLAGTKQ
ncbi:hypothetical protein GQ43DRAFT_396728 [Delitschia confertaspora ATCC 74209]|uniref:Uncharacterized protein n=1 Tax=Delitschia confertaspora ATCC 74209 TaxID=1513339 RepID=A0A9P4JLD6_9PLEO|nr:hypothetical protein GQ43DRAFT_396728 [Delitschia confertaspora ATCC 74209]